MIIKTLDWGTVIELRFLEGNSIVPLETATLKQIVFLKPDGVTKITKTAIFTTDGSDGKIQYTTIANDIDVGGTWKAEGYVETPLGGWATSSFEFEVDDRL